MLKVKNSNVKHTEYDFGGPLGTFFTMLLLPLVILTIHWSCGSSTNSTSALSCLSLSEILEWHPLQSRFPLKWKDLWCWQDLLIIIGWMGFQILLERILPAEIVHGEPLPNGKRLIYRINGHRALWTTLLCVVLGSLQWNQETNSVQLNSSILAYVYDHYLQLATSSIAFSIFLSTYLYWSSFPNWNYNYLYYNNKKANKMDSNEINNNQNKTKDKRDFNEINSTQDSIMLAKHGQSPSRIYNFFMGRELNPRIGNTFDLKYFCELRPGLIGWVVLNFGMLMKQHQIGNVTIPMILVNVFQFIYVWDGLYYEKSILTTMDVTTDGFGFMLAFGDLSWVPFIYSLQAKYLVYHQGETSTIMLIFIVLLNVTGYIIFRGANSMKDTFRRNPNSSIVAHFQWINTKRGTKLLISGWWGMARKINYTGDWMMGLAWCMLAGRQHLIPYFYCIYFGILLIHRALRDNGICKEKYGDDWEKYKTIVPYCFVPGVI